MSPKSKEQFEIIRQQSLSAIKEAALELFARQGFHSSSISQIAREAGVSKGLLYNYFDSKEALLVALVEDALRKGEEFMAGLADAHLPATDKLEQVVRRSFSWLRENVQYARLLASLSFQLDALPELKALIRKQSFSILEQLSELLAAAGMADPTREAMLTAALLDGISLHYMYLGDEYPLDEMESMVIEELKKKYNQ